MQFSGRRGGQVAMTRILPEGRLFLAVPNSSPMLMVGPEGAAGGGGVLLCAMEAFRTGTLVYFE